MFYDAAYVYGAACRSAMSHFALSAMRYAIAMLLLEHMPWSYADAGATIRLTLLRFCLSCRRRHVTPRLRAVTP